MLCCYSYQREQFATLRRAVPSSSPTGVRAISIFYQFIQFLGATNDGEVDVIFISPFHLFTDSAKHPADQLRSPPTACLPSSFALLPPPSSRGGRPVSAGPIEKQRSKMCFPVSFPSLMSKHSNRSRKNAVPQFLLTMILLSSCRRVLRHENLTNLKIYDIIYLQGEGRKKNHLHHLHYA